ncbi:MAG: hypothetical protein DBP03_04855 [gamma proteobacterium symbiont of Ctena orbiculata]|nr:MAG: hypothetical protein DBP03_04855 [gamma proteobacterium symbiont of Ctena orbiculata]
MGDKLTTRKPPPKLRISGRFPLRSVARAPYGVMDMAGNVWEWCLNKLNNPQDTTIDGSRSSRGLRGGSCFRTPEDARTTNRNGAHPVFRDDYRGFRVVSLSPIIR